MSLVVANHKKSHDVAPLFKNKVVWERRERGPSTSPVTDQMKPPWILLPALNRRLDVTKETMAKLGSAPRVVMLQRSLQIRLNERMKYGFHLSPPERLLHLTP